MFANLINNIISWFSDRTERNRLIRSFNSSAKEAFIQGVVPTLLNSSISKGDSNYRHQYSNFFNSGFRIIAFTGKVLSKNEILQIGQTIITNDVLMRKLVVLGFDTLEIQGDKGLYGCKWQVKDFIQLSYDKLKN